MVFKSCGGSAMPRVVEVQCLAVVGFLATSIGV